MRRPFVLGLVLALALTGVAAAIVVIPGRLKRHQTGNGRILRPAAKLARVGHFPTGGALTPDGRLYFAVSTGRALNDIRAVRLDGRRPRVSKVLPLPGASGGIALDAPRRLLYVSGIKDSSNKDQERPGLRGREGDVIHVIRYDRRGGLRELRTIAVPAPSTAPPPQNFPPTNATERSSYPQGLAVSGDGRRLLVALNLADAAAVVDVGSGRVRYVPTGRLPYGAAILPGGKRGLVTNSTAGTMSVVDLDAATKVKDIQVGSHLSHAEEIVVDPRRGRAFAPLANTDQVAMVDTRRLTLARSISVERPEGRGVSPNAVALSRSGGTLYVSEGSADELAVVPLSGRRAFRVSGRIPTAAYPADVQLSRSRLVWLAAKGFGARPNPDGPNPYSASDDSLLKHPGTAVLSPGFAGVQPIPGARALRALTRTAGRDLRPATPARRPADTPLRPGGPIKHVFFVVRENRTYDQVLGDEPRGDGDKALALFGGRVTPNIHALVQRFPLLDHVYANSEASIDGHFWTSAAQVSDYVHKNWQQNYAGRGRPYDFGVYAATWPGKGFLFDQADRQGISYFNFGEAVAGTVPLNIPGIGRFINDADRSASDEQGVLRKFGKSDLGSPVGCYDNDASIGRNAITRQEAWDSTPPFGSPPTAGSRFDCFKQRFSTWMLPGRSAPTFTYMVLPSDHTEGTTPGRRSPRAMVAENDYALGQIVDLVSHSKIWKSSAIFVLEDDSQDGADHVDAHRMPAAVFSPYARRGAVVHDRYDMLSMIRSMELVMGMKPLGLADNVATPMWRAFTSRPDLEPYDVVRPTYPINERNAETAANARLSRSLRLNRTDAVPQRVLDRILWQSVHGARSTPPPPGPNAQPEGRGPADPDG